MENKKYKVTITNLATGENKFECETNAVILSCEDIGADGKLKTATSIILKDTFERCLCTIKGAEDAMNNAQEGLMKEAMRRMFDAVSSEKEENGDDGSC